jgi:hypothetical protein
VAVTQPIPAAGPEIQALITTLQAALQPAVGVYYAEVTGTPAGQYVVVYPAPASLAAPKLDSELTELDHVVQVTCCGPSSRDAMAAADAARAAIAGRRLIVTGRSCGRIRQEPLNAPMIRDDTSRSTTNLSTYSLATEYRWTSTPA